MMASNRFGMNVIIAMGQTSLIVVASGCSDRYKITDIERSRQGIRQRLCRKSNENVLNAKIVFGSVWKNGIKSLLTITLTIGRTAFVTATLGSRSYSRIDGCGRLGHSQSQFMVQSG